MKTKILLFSIALGSIVTVESCKKEKPEPTTPPTSTPDPNAALKQSIKENYANIAFAVYEDAYYGATDLQIAIYAFVAAPSPVTQAAAQQAWKDAREPYGQSEVFRFSDGPIDDLDGPEGFINAWPMDEGFVDYIVGAPGPMGIINNPGTYPTIDAALLLDQNESGSETNIATGFHAIEFLLWGQDLSAGSAGMRPYTDFIPGAGPGNEARRCAYLTTCIDLLVQMLAQVKNEWDPAMSGNYREQFLAMSNNVALQKMFNQMAALSHNELAGERMFVAYTSMSQEDEHSCFSDNTHRDIILNAKGIYNIYTGTYVRTDLSVVTGDALEDLVALVNSTKNAELLTLLNDSQTATNALYVPFDQAIVIPAERTKVMDAVTKLQAEGNKLVEVAALLGLTVTL